WIHADDGFDRSKAVFESHYFHDTRESLSEDARIDVPPGEIIVDVQKGFDYRPEQRKISLTNGDSHLLTIMLRPFDWKQENADHWVGGDLHVHMNYGGVYVNYPQNLGAQAEAEDLQIVNNLIVNKEQRFPDIAYNGAGVDAASDRDVLIIHGQEFHTSYWGHRGLVGL